ncbi:unnamed protein product [Arctia plantaginis]|uniref:Uncharacterized protein n=1 Tax=Arctia plantaginis TaxID=874455 RepID=A0A8S1BGX2_ARCPL|nr:unnamed protein product [Arctia plantaginis]
MVVFELLVEVKVQGLFLYQVKASIGATRALLWAGGARTQLETGIDAARTNLNAAQALNERQKNGHRS